MLPVYLRPLQETSTEDCPVKVKLVAPPLYVLTTQTLDKVKGVEVGHLVSVGSLCGRTSSLAQEHTVYIGL